MSSKTKIADDVISIAARLAELEAERLRRINAAPIEVCSQCKGVGTVPASTGNMTPCPSCTKKTETKKAETSETDAYFGCC